MSLQNIPLRKLLKIMFLPTAPQRSAIRDDIRRDRAHAQATPGDEGGGDFYGPFWADAKEHVFDQKDIRKAVNNRITKNKHRRNLYPRLRDGFLRWWHEQRHWKKPLKIGKPLKARLELSMLAAIIKIDSVLSVQDDNGNKYYVYPYFSPEPALTEESSRFGLWLLQKVLATDIQHEQICILDVIRGREFSFKNVPLSGNEESLFYRRYKALLQQRDELRKDYE